MKFIYHLFEDKQKYLIRSLFRSKSFQVVRLAILPKRRSSKELCALFIFSQPMTSKRDRTRGTKTLVLCSVQSTNLLDLYRYSAHIPGHDKATIANQTLDYTLEQRTAYSAYLGHTRYTRHTRIQICVYKMSYIT